MRTDQLDGETDWKLRVAVPCVQALTSDEVCNREMEGVDERWRGLMKIDELWRD